LLLVVVVARQHKKKPSKMIENKSIRTRRAFGQRLNTTNEQIGQRMAGKGKRLQKKQQQNRTPQRQLRVIGPAPSPLLVTPPSVFGHQQAQHYSLDELRRLSASPVVAHLSAHRRVPLGPWSPKHVLQQQPQQQQQQQCDDIKQQQQPIDLSKPTTPSIGDNKHANQQLAPRRRCVGAPLQLDFSESTLNGAAKADTPVERLPRAKSAKYAFFRTVCHAFR
jgi:hypothetical protein